MLFAPTSFFCVAGNSYFKLHDISTMATDTSQIVYRPRITDTVLTNDRRIQRSYNFSFPFSFQAVLNHFADALFVSASAQTLNVAVFVRG